MINLFTYGCILTQQPEYRIIRIENEAQVPLGSGFQVEYYGVATAVMILVFLSYILSVYIGCCVKCRNRIKQLEPEFSPGWNLIKLRQMVKEAEIFKVSEFVDIAR